MTVHYIRKVADLDADRAKYRLQGIAGTAGADSTTDIDWRFPEERWITGGIFAVNNGNWGDSATIQIIDIDNVLGYGANVVLDTFAENYGVMSDQQFQGDIECPYVALIPAGLYIRIKYTNTSESTAAQILLNLHSHIPRA